MDDDDMNDKKIGAFTPTLERELRELDHMDRWQIIRVIRKQSIASHSWLVSIYALRIAEMIKWVGDYHALMFEALTHDLDEIITGDLPRTFKWALQNIPGAKDALDDIKQKEMCRRFSWWTKTDNQDVRMIIHFADMLESLLYLYEEQGLGNKRGISDQLISEVLEQTRHAADIFDKHFKTENIASCLVSNSVADEELRHSKILKCHQKSQTQS